MTAPTGSALTGPPREALREKLRALGFDEVRFAAVGAPVYSLREWLNAGDRGEMAWVGRSGD
jgi:epoxyqueuosine reductase